MEARIVSENRRLLPFGIELKTRFSDGDFGAFEKGERLEILRSPRFEKGIEDSMALTALVVESLLADSIFRPRVTTPHDGKLGDVGNERKAVAENEKVPTRGTGVVSIRNVKLRSDEQ